MRITLEAHGVKIVVSEEDNPQSDNKKTTLKYDDQRRRVKETLVDMIDQALRLLPELNIANELDNSKE